MFFRALTVAFVALGLASCASGPRPLTGEHLVVLPVDQLPPPAGPQGPGAARTYTIGTFDTLQIDVLGVEELSRRQIQVDAGSHIALPLAGSIDVTGMTPEQLSQEIERRLRGRYVRDPHVTVNVTETVSQVVTIDGEVREPGLYPVTGGMTLMRAIASAKGPSEFARLSQVVVFRTVGDQRYAALYDLGAIRAGRYADPEIFANDVVVVGNSPARRLFRDILQASPLLISPIVALIQSNVL